MPVSSPSFFRSRWTGLTARALVVIAALPLAACNSGGDAPRDGGSGGVRPVFFISALEAEADGGAPGLAAPGKQQPSFS